MNTIRPLLYKEWIKSRTVALIAFGVALLCLFYSLYNFRTALHLKGVAHLWSVMIDRDALFVERMRHIPMLLGCVVAIAQMVPEVLQKRLKLTLHLPITDARGTCYMLLFGVGIIVVYIAIMLIGIASYYGCYMPRELLLRILRSMIPWCLAGPSAYFLTSWVILEGRLMQRIVALLISVGLLLLYFSAQIPEAYPAGMMATLLLLTVFSSILPLHAVNRFRKGFIH